MTTVFVPVPLAFLPELMKIAVAAVPRATLIEVTEEDALVGRRTNFASRAETTRFTFHPRDDGGCVIRARSSNLLVYGSLPYAPDSLLDTGRAVLTALVAAAAENQG